MADLGVSTWILEDADSFHHDFLLHGMGLPELTNRKRQRLLRFLTEVLRDEALLLRLAHQLAVELGPNVRLRVNWGDLPPHFWFRTPYGETAAYGFEHYGAHVPACLYEPELGWSDLEFVAVDASGAVIGAGVVLDVGTRAFPDL